MSHLSNRKVAEYAAEQLLDKKPSRKLIDQIAAYLISTKRTHQELAMVDAIETALLHRGVAVASVSSARPLDAANRAQIVATIKQQLPGVNRVHLRESVDAGLLGGITISVPGRRLEASIYDRLQQFKTVTASEA